MTKKSNDSMNDSMLKHKDLPILVEFARKVKIMKEEIRVKTGVRWKSKQLLPADNYPVDLKVKGTLELGEQLKSLLLKDRGIVHRGDFPTLDTIIDYTLKIFRKELSDMTAFEEASSKVAASSGTASASGGASVAAATGEVASYSSPTRKRSHFDVEKDSCVTNVPKRAEGALVATLHSPQSRNPTDEAPAIAANSKGLSKWQADKLMEWMKQNDYNPSPGLDALDELVQSTRLKPSQIVAWTAEVGGTVIKLRNTVNNCHEVITIDDDGEEEEEETVEESIPELAEEEDGDDWNGFIADDLAGLSASKPHSAPPDGLEDEFGAGFVFASSDWESLESLDSLDSLDFELGVGVGKPDSSCHMQPGHSSPSGEKSSAPFESLAVCEELELFEFLSSHGDRPSKRACLDSLDSLFALLD